MDRPILPTDIIPVPVRTIVEKKTLFGRASSQEEVKVLYITRDLYHRKYAKDENGNYIGSESPAEDAGIAKVDYFHSDPPPYPNEVGRGGGEEVGGSDGMASVTSYENGGAASDLPSYERSGSSALLSARVNRDGAELRSRKTSSARA